MSDAVEMFELVERERDGMAFVLIDDQPVQVTDLDGVPVLMATITKRQQGGESCTYRVGERLATIHPFGK